MHPALSIIFFTTLSGAGYGLVVALVLRGWTGPTAVSPAFGLAGLGLATALIVAGLLSSTLHLKHPERAWRAISQWRSSWLSREGVAALLTFPPIAVFAWGWVIEGAIWSAAGVIAALGALVTVYCTSMIYHALKTVPQWRHPRVPLVFTLLSWATGFALLTAIEGVFGQLDRQIVNFTVTLLVVAWFFKFLYWRAIDKMEPGDTGHATGLGGAGDETGKTVRPLFPPHSQGNYLLSEMGFKVARKHARKLRRMALILGAAVPVMALGLALVAPALTAALLAIIAACSSLAGTLIERWLFFAEATHSMMQYYEAGATTAHSD